jgi:tripartite-type tricarboxylate transporter receptor subunit TctC
MLACGRGVFEYIQAKESEMTLHRRVLCGLLAAVPCLALAQTAPAGYPNRAVRMVVPFTPGGTTDILGRAIAQELSRALGQSFVVENIPGAGGSIGAERVAKAAPDGYTLMMGHIGTLAVNPSLYPKLPYDPVKDFAPIAWVASVPNVLVVHPSLPVKTLAELVAYAKGKPGQLNYGSGGNGSAANLVTEYLKIEAGISVVHIPYRGTAPAVTDLLSGQIQMMFTGVPALSSHLKSGAVRPLAVSSPKRLAVLPEVPTVEEALGIKGFAGDQWYGVVAPAGTPREIVAFLNGRINASLDSAELKTRLAAEGAIATPNPPAAFGELIAREIEQWRPVIKQSIQAN